MLDPWDAMCTGLSTEQLQLITMFYTETAEAKVKAVQEYVKVRVQAAMV